MRAKRRSASGQILLLTLVLMLAVVLPRTFRKTDVVPVSEESGADYCRVEDGRLLLNLNEASAEDLCLLKGIGEKLSERIIDYREEKGGFDSIQELIEVEGIGASTLQKIADQLYCG